MQAHDHAEQGSANKHEDVNQLMQWLEHFSRLYRVSASRKERCENLMQRQSAKSWSHKKSSKMVRRLVAASKDMNESESTLDRIQQRLSQNNVDIDVELYKTWSPIPLSNQRQEA